MGASTFARYNMFLDELGQRLRDRREARQLTQLDVAAALQVSPQAVSKWERGENAPDITLFAGLSQLLGTTTDWLLGRFQPDGNVFHATVFVSSIQGFTKRSETMKPEDVAMWANGFLHQVTEAVVHEGGIPVKYLGDALLAFFTGDRHEVRAASAALLARRVVTDQLVAGLASGPVYFTPIGHERYARPDIMGSTVNKAFRVLAWAAANTSTGVGAAFGPEWRPSVEMESRVHTDVSLKGLMAPVELYELAAST